MNANEKVMNSFTLETLTFKIAFLVNTGWLIDLQEMTEYRWKKFGEKQMRWASGGSFATSLFSLEEAYKLQSEKR